MPSPTVEDDKVIAKIRVMVVEDEGLVALSPQRKLRDLGYEIPAIAATGEQVIQRATELRSALRGDDSQIEFRIVFTDDAPTD